MKTTTLLTSATALMLGFASLAAEFKPDKNGVKLGATSRVNILPTAVVSMTDPDLFASFSLSMATKHPKRWFSPGSCSPKAGRPDDNTWTFTAQAPASETEFVEVEVRAAATPFNTLELSYSWKVADPKNILEVGVFLSLPSKTIEEGEIIVNGETLKVENKTAYGWFRKKLDKAEVTLFKNQDGRELTVSTDKPIRILIQSTKDRGSVIRFLPENNETALNLTVTPK